ncbi:MAG: SOS response-associated peptidase [Glaciihabitans sp.]
MCGRFVLDRKTSDLVALFEVDVTGAVLPEPSWNIAPTQQVRVVIDSLPKGDEVVEPVRRLESARWGLVPGFAKDPSGPPLFNARSETVAEKPAFETALRSRRAVVPASGYYEWVEVNGTKTPHYVSLPGDELFLFAGLYDWWRNPAATTPEERWLLSTTILTRPSSGPLTDIHERMPVFLEADLVEEWLDPLAEGSAELVGITVDNAEKVAERAEFYAVGDSVGSVQNNGAGLLAADAR